MKINAPKVPGTFGAWRGRGTHPLAGFSCHGDGGKKDERDTVPGTVFHV